MNYKHIYHAGNFTEILKHSVLTLIIGYLKEKPTPFCYIDTHSGEGLYSLKSPEAEKTGEYKNGVLQLLDYPGPHPDELRFYLEALKPYQHSQRIDFYPGSPLIAYSMLRDMDRMILNEFQPLVNQALKQNFYDKSNVSIHQRDGYEFLPAMVPPKESRGVVLIDPPFEKTDEDEKIQKTLEQSLKRWPQGIYMIWYPITSQRNYDPRQVIRALSIEKFLLVKLTVASASPQNKGLVGSKLLIINPPWKLAEKLQILLPHLWKILSLDGQGEWSVITN